MDKIQQIGKRYFNKKIDEIIIIINIKGKRSELVG